MQVMDPGDGPSRWPGAPVEGQRGGSRRSTPWEKVEELCRHWTEDTGVGMAGPSTHLWPRWQAENVSPAAETFPKGTGHVQQSCTLARQVRKVEVT